MYTSYAQLLAKQRPAALFLICMHFLPQLTQLVVIYLASSKKKPRLSTFSPKEALCKQTFWCDYRVGSARVCVRALRAARFRLAITAVKDNAETGLKQV